MRHAATPCLCLLLPVSIAPRCSPRPLSAVDALGLDYLTMGQCAGILVAYISICCGAAYLGVRFLKH